MNPHKSYPVARGVAPPPGYKSPVPTPIEVVLPAVDDPELLDDAPPMLDSPSPRRWVGGVLHLLAMVVVVSVCTAVGWVTVGRHRVTPVTEVMRSDKPVTPPAVKVEVPVLPPPPQPKEEPKPPPPKEEPKPVVKAPPPKAEPKPPVKTPPATNLSFAKDVQPILKQRCETCHGFMGKIKGGLDLRTLNSLLKGGESGPAVVRGKPETSPLVERIADGSMPPSGKKVPDADLDKIKQWIAGGAR
ncbi:MAG: c-type cytochrome domain-containing protein [Gemmataceae bacterium]